MRTRNKKAKFLKCVDYPSNEINFADDSYPLRYSIHSECCILLNLEVPLELIRAGIEITF